MRTGAASTAAWYSASEGGQLPAVGGGVGGKVLRVGGVHPAHRIRDGIGEQLRVAQREPDVLVVFGFGVGVAVVVLMGGLHASVSSSSRAALPSTSSRLSTSMSWLTASCRASSTQLSDVPPTYRNRSQEDTSSISAAVGW